MLSSSVCICAGVCVTCHKTISRTAHIFVRSRTVNTISAWSAYRTRLPSGFTHNQCELPDVPTGSMDDMPTEIAMCCAQFNRLQSNIRHGNAQKSMCVLACTHDRLCTNTELVGGNGDASEASGRRRRVDVIYKSVDSVARRQGFGGPGLCRVG